MSIAQRPTDALCRSVGPCSRLFRPLPRLGEAEADGFGHRVDGIGVHVANAAEDARLGSVCIDHI
jgi:hypothetical protein